MEYQVTEIQTPSSLICTATFIAPKVERQFVYHLLQVDDYAPCTDQRRQSLYSKIDSFFENEMQLKWNVWKFNEFVSLATQTEV